MDWTKFLNDSKGIVIAPAGHGKTYAIASCVQQSTSSKPILILTHTHAGIVSLKQKLKEHSVNSSKYHLETISGLAQRYVLSFCKAIEFGSQQNKDYFDKIQKKASLLFSRDCIRKVFSSSYSHLIVDEYQDCSKLQHQMIMQLAQSFPTHLFGDPLQGIFDFPGKPIVDFTTDLSDFTVYNLLDKPQRWLQQGNSEALGRWILDKRIILESKNKCFRLESNISANIEIVKHDLIDKNNVQTALYNKIASKLRSCPEQSLLILMPSFTDEQERFRGSITERTKMLSRFDFDKTIKLLEAIDDDKYYSCASAIDEYITKIAEPKCRIQKIARLKDLLDNCTFAKVELNRWFKENTLIRKQKKEHVLFEKLNNLVTDLFANPSIDNFIPIFNFFYVENRSLGHRPDIVFSIAKCLNEAMYTGKPVYDCMCGLKNQVRHIGRKIDGRCFGTTLLTKGLEFDTVILLYANRITDSRHFYVAISRACKQLIIFTENLDLEFER